MHALACAHARYKTMCLSFLPCSSMSTSMQRHSPQPFLYHMCTPWTQERNAALSAEIVAAQRRSDELRAARHECILAFIAATEGGGGGGTDAGEKAMAVGRTVAGPGGMAALISMDDGGNGEGGMEACGQCALPLAPPLRSPAASADDPVKAASSGMGSRSGGGGTDSGWETSGKTQC